MRELTQQEIDQVSAGPTPSAPVAIPTTHHAAASSILTSAPFGLDLSFVLTPLAEGKLA